MSGVSRLADALLPPALLVSLLGLTLSTRASWRDPPPATSGVHLQIPGDVRFVGSIDTPLETETESYLLIGGWAAATTPGQQVSAVELYVNDRLAGRITDFSLRDDVAAAYSRPDFARTGWRCFVSTRGLKPALYDLEMRVVTSEGKSVSVLKKPMTVLE
jgi:hypothetical protein